MANSFYKIADGPLDIRTKEIQVLVNGVTNPVTIYLGQWYDFAEDSPGAAVISGAVYAAEIALGYSSYESIFICDNAVLNSEIFAFGGEMPFTGIFVSEGIESIIIPEGEEVHQIDEKYIPQQNSKHILAIIDSDTDEQQMIGAGYVSERSGSELAMRLVLTFAAQLLSPQDIGPDDRILNIEEVSIRMVGSTISDTDANYHSDIYFDSGDNCFIIHLPGITVTDTFCITYEELIGDYGDYPIYKNSSFILYVNSFELI